MSCLNHGIRKIVSTNARGNAPRGASIPIPVLAVDGTSGCPSWWVRTVPESQRADPSPPCYVTHRTACRPMLLWLTGAEGKSSFRFFWYAEQHHTSQRLLFLYGLWYVRNLCRGGLPCYRLGRLPYCHRSGRASLKILVSVCVTCFRPTWTWTVPW